MNKCKDCVFYKETYPKKGYCHMWDEYVKEDEGCTDWRDE